MSQQPAAFPDYGGAAAELLGGEAVLGRCVRSSSDLRGLERELPVAAPSAIAERFGSDVLIALLPHLRHQQLSLHRGWPSGGDTLWAVNGRATIEGALVLAHAVDVLGSAAKVRQWLLAEISSLGGRRPIDLLEFDQLRDVDDILGRIEHGIPA
jgi:Protein of unknown function (DUF2384)